MFNKNRYVGLRYVPKIFGEWDKTKNYEPLSIVTYQGNSFTSKTFVPSNADINDNHFWVQTANYNAQFESLRNSFNNNSNELEKRLDNFKSKQDTEFKNLLDTHKQEVQNYINSVQDDLKEQKTELENGGLTDVNNKINIIENLDFLNDKCYLFASYQSKDFNENQDFSLYISNNTNICYKLNNSEILSFVTGKPLFDICAFYDNETFYFIGDYRENEQTVGGNAFLLISTKDFVTFNQKTIKITSSHFTVNQTWAPKLFKDNDKYLLVYAVQRNGNSFIDTKMTSYSHGYFEIAYSFALDNTLENWSEPIILNLGDHSKYSYIDPFIFKKDNEYHLFACHDDGATIEHFTNSSLNSVWKFSDTVPFKCVTEGPSIMQFNNKYYILTDSYRATGKSDTSFYQVMESTDLFNWTNLHQLKNNSNTIIRHFSPIVLNDKQKNIIKKVFFNDKNLNNNYVFASENSIKAVEKNNISYFDLASITDKNTKVLDELYVMPNTIYHLDSIYDTLTINKINASLLKNFDKFSFVLNSFGDTKLIIKNNSNKGGFLPTQTDLIIDGKKGSNLYTFTVLDGYIKCITPLEQNTINFNFVKNGDFLRDNLNMFIGFNNYTPTFDNSGEYVYIKVDDNTEFVGIGQNIDFIKNSQYEISTEFFIKNKSLFTDNIGLTVKGVKKATGENVEFMSNYLNVQDIKEFYGNKISFKLDISKYNLDDYQNVYVYLFLQKQGELFVKNIHVNKI